MSRATREEVIEAYSHTLSRREGLFGRERDLPYPKPVIREALLVMIDGAHRQANLAAAEAAKRRACGT